MIAAQPTPITVSWSKNNPGKGQRHQEDHEQHRL